MQHQKLLRELKPSRATHRLGLCLALAVGSAALSTGAQPVNDNFSSRLHLARASMTWTSSLAGATSEANEPVIPAVTTGQSAWWSWTAPGRGTLALSCNGTGFNPLVAVYTGNELSSLSLVASNTHLSAYQNCGFHWRVREHMVLPVAAGQTYQLAVDSALDTQADYIRFLYDPESYVYLGMVTNWTTNVLAGGEYRLGLRFAAAPKNDDFERRTLIAGSAAHFKAANAGASKQPGEPDHMGNAGGSSLWYTWRAPASGRVTLSTNWFPHYPLPDDGDGGSSGSTGGTVIPDPVFHCGPETDQSPPPEFYPVFGVYTGSSLDSLTPVGCLAMQHPGFSYAVCFDAVKGQVYQIAFDGNGGATGKATVHLRLTKPARNDSFERRAKLHGIYDTATGHNVGATPQLGEPSPAPGALGKTVWWTWTAPVSGNVTLNLTGSEYAFSMAVFAGTNFSTLQKVAESAGGLWWDPAEAEVSFEAVEGQTYHFAVGDCEGLTGAIKLELRAPMVDLALAKSTLRSPRAMLLQYAATPGQVVLLMRSSDLEGWEPMRTVVAHGDQVSFLVRPTIDGNGPFYRAVIIDRLFY